MWKYCPNSQFLTTRCGGIKTWILSCMRLHIKRDLLLRSFVEMLRPLPKYVMFIWRSITGDSLILTWEFRSALSYCGLIVIVDSSRHLPLGCPWAWQVLISASQFVRRAPAWWIGVPSYFHVQNTDIFHLPTSTQITTIFGFSQQTPYWLSASGLLAMA